MLASEWASFLFYLYFLFLLQSVLQRFVINFIIMKKSLYIFFTALCCTFGLQAQNSNNLWINEFHYDGAAEHPDTQNPLAGPANEFIELIVHDDIVNNAAELAKYQVVLYAAGASVVNVNTPEGIKGLPYDKASRLYSAEETYHPLNDGFQICDVSDKNFSVLSKDLSVLQDLPSAIGIIYDNSVVVQLVSYEKAFRIKDTPEAGPAAGKVTSLMVSSTNNPVTEDGNSNNGSSMQLGRNSDGAGYDDFRWSSGSTASKCAVNSNQTIDNLPAVEPNDGNDPLAVQLIDFIGKAQEESVALSWRTAMERDNKGFYLERRRSDEAVFTTLDFIAGKGTTNQTQVYNYLDTEVKAGQVYYYRLVQLDNNDRKTNSNTVAVKLVGSDVFMMVTPNPATDVVNVRLENIKENATLQVTTMSGKVVRTVNLAAAKMQNYNLNVADLSTGFYLLRVENGQEVLTQKLSVL